MIQELVHDPFFLSGKSASAAKEDLPIAQELVETLQAHRDVCLGMAANMIGRRKRIIAFYDWSGQEPAVTVMLNPEIIRAGDIYDTEESCLSLTGGPRPCKRYQTICVRFQSMQMKTCQKTYSGRTAQAIQHEIDHCKGVLI